MKVQFDTKLYQDLLYKKWVQNIEQSRIDSAEKIKDYIKTPVFPCFPSIFGGNESFIKILNRNIKDAKQRIQNLWK